MKKLLFLLLPFFSFQLFAQTQFKQHTEVELISETKSAQPGQSVWVGLRFNIDDDWHIYWRNPGDSGIPPTFSWTTPKGVTVGDIQWTFPEKVDYPPLTSFVYSNTVLLMSEVKVPENYSGQNLTLQLHAEWLICQDICMPGDGDFELTLPVANETPSIDPEWQTLFTETRFKLPITLTDWKFSLVHKEKAIEIHAQKPQWFSGDIQQVRFFPFEQEIIENIEEQPLTLTTDGFVLTVPLATQTQPTKLEGVLVNDIGWRGNNSERAINLVIDENNNLTTATITEILLALLFAFIGGMILNLMPCVLPVLSLKIFGFVQQANNEKSSALKHGIIFTFGVLISFWILAGLLLVLRSGGEQLGWGFQLQSPTFIIILSSFLFLFALSLFGVFEIGTSLTQAGSIGSKSEGWLGSFMNGVTATIVATPCTAPFMGTALGFALSQPAYVSLLIFTFLGLGMAFPYLVLASSPALLKFVPRPGEWMNTFKQVMGFLLLATILWLMWVLGIQAGSMALVGLSAGLLLLGFAGWLLGKYGSIMNTKKSRVISQLVVTLITLSALFVSIKSLELSSAPISNNVANQSSEAAGMVWEHFTPERYTELKNSGKPFFIDFTAAWCLSCQVNDKVVFSSSDVIGLFKSKSITALKADWTSRDENITKALASYGRNSVPLYVLYDGKNSSPTLLPEILTPGTMLDALQTIQ